MQWVVPFTSTQKGIFKTPDGETDVTYMYSTESELINLGNAKGFVKTMTNGCKVAAIIPNEDVKLSSVVELIDFAGISSILNYAVKVDGFTVKIPEFSYQKISDCVDILSKCGLDRALSAEKSGFGNLSENSAPLYISNIYSAVSVSFGKSGVTVGGASSGADGTASADATTIEADLTYDHPFIYVVYDPDGVPLFIGNVVQP
jgi:serine protease inhibitor